MHSTNLDEAARLIAEREKTERVMKQLTTERLKLVVAEHDLELTTAAETRLRSQLFDDFRQRMDQIEARLGELGVEL